MEYHESEEIYSNLVQNGLTDHQIIVFNSVYFLGYARSFWEVAEHIVQWRKDNRGIFFDYFCTA